MAEKTLEIGIIGLGKFGLRMATTLASMGHTVIGIDMSDARVQLAEELLDTVYKADATSLSVLRSLHVQDLDWVVISVGEGVEQSLSITLNVQELGGPKIWVKASNEEHKKILQRLHVDRAIVPEMEAAVMAAHQLCHPGMLDLIPKYGGIAIQELRVDNWHGRTLVDLNLIQSFGVMVMGIRPAGERAFQFVPPALTVLHKGDTLWWPAGPMPCANLSRNLTGAVFGQSEPPAKRVVLIVPLLHPRLRKERIGPCHGRAAGTNGADGAKMYPPSQMNVCNR